MPAARGWLLYTLAVVGSLAVAVIALVTVLIGAYASSVAVATGVAQVTGFALSGVVAVAVDTHRAGTSLSRRRSSLPRGDLAGRACTELGT